MEGTLGLEHVEPTGGVDVRAQVREGPPLHARPDEARPGEHNWTTCMSERSECGVQLGTEASVVCILTRRCQRGIQKIKWTEP